jgi:Sulfotransferase family
MRSRPDHGPPHFVGVGALGSGTGWWHRLLLAHPEIAPPAGRRRALHFFDRFCAQEMTDADIAAYHERFPRSEEAISGEWTGRYMLDPWTAPLLRRAAPDAKLLAMLSDPIERYKAVFTDRKSKLAEGDRLFTTDVVDRRSFGAQLARLHRFFDPGRILVLQFERCRRDPAGQYRRTLEFLGVRDTAYAPRRLRHRTAARLLGLVAPRRVGEQLAGRPLSEHAAEPLWPDLEASLHTALDPDVEALRELVPELDLALWPNFAHLARGSA